MDHRIFNVRTWSFFSACVYTRGLGTPTASQHSILPRKNSHNFCVCSWRGLNLGSLDLESDALPIEPPRHPIFCNCTVSLWMLLGDGGRGSVVRESNFKSEDPGFDPLAGQVEGSAFSLLSLRVNSCADLFASDRPLCIVLYCIDRRVYLNLFKSTQSAAWGWKLWSLLPMGAT